MTILVIGASGQVGSLLHQSCSRSAPRLRTYCHHPTPGLSGLDLRDHDAVTHLIHELQPTVCYLPGALTFVDYAETHPQECLAINVAGVANLARALADSGGTLVL